MQHTTPNVPLHLKRTSTVALSAVLALSLCPGVGSRSEAHAVTAAEKQAEAQQALENLNGMQETLDRLSVEYGEALAAQEEAEASRDAAEARIGEIKEEVADLQGRLSERAREMYRSGGISFVEILLGANTFEEFATSWDMLTKVNENDADMVQERKRLQIEAEEQAAIFNEQAVVAAQKSEEAAEAERQAEATIAEMQATYESLNEEAQKLLEEERAAREAAEAARAAAVVAASAAAAEASESAGGSNGGEAPSGESSGSKKQSKKADGGSASSDELDEGESDAESDEKPDDGSANESDEEESDDDSSADEGGSDTVSRAYACLGADYVWGGVGPNGYDCSGLVSYCLTGSHTRLGTTSTFMGWPQVSDPQPGDICVNNGHTGVYIGNGQMIHAATYGVGVIIGPVQSGMIIVRWQG